jgi:zinc and cadmium transporter
MNTLTAILISVFIVSAISLIGIVTFLFKSKSLDRIFFVLVSFATGSMLGAAFLDLLPEAVGKAPPEKVFASALLGILIFFLMEKFLYWYHCHEGECDVHQFTYLSLVGDGIHNFLDGVIIAAAFLVNTQAGVVTTIAIVLHEIPQELGDFGILIYGGFSRVKALVCNFLTALTAVAGAVTAYFFLDKIEGFTSLMIGVAAGGFIYISCTDLIPELKKERRISRSIQQLVLILLGIGVISAGKFFFKE